MNKFEQKKYYGAQVLYDKSNEQAKALADEIQASLNQMDKTIQTVNFFIRRQRLFFQNMTINGYDSHYLYRVFFYLCKHQKAFSEMNKNIRNKVFSKIVI